MKIKKSNAVCENCRVKLTIPRIDRNKTYFCSTRCRKELDRELNWRPIRVIKKADQQPDPNPVPPYSQMSAEDAAKLLVQRTNDNRRATEAIQSWILEHRANKELEYRAAMGFWKES